MVVVLEPEAAKRKYFCPSYLAMPEPRNISPDCVVLGLETSCDETAAAVVTGKREVLANVVLSQLDDHTKTGVATLAILRDEFRDLASTIVAKARNPAAEGWLDKVMAEIRTLATVRRTNGGASETVENLVARAETRLTTGDLAAAVKAVKAIKQLSPEAASASAAWLDRAVSRLSMERALAVLYIHAVSSLGGAAKE